MKKKVLSMLVTFAMLLSMLPTTVLAVEMNSSAGDENLDSNEYYEYDSVYSTDEDTDLVLLPAAFSVRTTSTTAEAYTGAYGDKDSVIGATFTVDEKAAGYDDYEVYYQVMFDRNVFIETDNETAVEFGYAADTNEGVTVAPITGYEDPGHYKNDQYNYLTADRQNIIRNSDPVEISTGYTYKELSARDELTIALFDKYGEDTLDDPSGLPTGTRAAINLVLKAENEDDVLLGHYTGMVGELPKVTGTTYEANIMGATVPAVHFKLSSKAEDYITTVGSLEESVLKEIMGEDAYTGAAEGWQEYQSEGFTYEYYMGMMAIQSDAESNNDNLASAMGDDYLTMEELQNLMQGGDYPTMANWLADVEVTFTSDTLTSVDDVMVILYAGNTLNASGSNIVGGKEFVDTPLVIGETYRVIEGTVSTVTSFSNYTYGVRSGAVNLSELMQLTSGASIAAVCMAEDESIVALPENVEMNVEVKLYPNDADRYAGGWGSADPRNGEFSKGGFGGSGVSANYELEWAYLYGNANYDKLIELNEEKYGANNIFTRYYPEGEGPFTYLENYAWDGGYSYTVWPAENEADPPAEPDPLPPVDPEPIPEPEASTGAPSVTIPGNLELTDEQKAAIEETARSIEIPDLGNIAETLTNDISENDVNNAVSALKNTITVSDDDTVSVHVQAYLDIQPSDYIPSADGTPGTLTLNITPKSRLVATIAENAADIKLDDDNKNAIVYGDAEEIGVTTSVTITVELPDGFAISDSEGGYYPIEVKHCKGNGTTYKYRADVDNDGKKATFENPNGFSTFEFTPMTSYPVDLPDYDSHELTDDELDAFFAGSDYEETYKELLKIDDGVFGMNFTAKEDAKEAETKPYADYNADFVLTANKDTAVLMLGNYGKWGTKGFVAQVKADEGFRAIADSEIGTTYGKQPYKGVVDYVGEFDCVAIPITDEFKAAYKAATGKTDLDSYPSADPGVTLTLELKLYETEPDLLTTKETGTAWTIGSAHSFTYYGLPDYDSRELTASELTTFFAGSDYESIYNALKNKTNRVFGMKYSAKESLDIAESKPYADYNADFVLTADKDMNVLMLGNYGEYGTIGFVTSLKAGEGFRAIADSEIGNTYGKQPYEGVVRYVGVFDCVAIPITDDVKAAYKAATGKTDLDSYASAGDDATLTLALNLYETEPFSTTTKETGKYWTLGTIQQFTYDAPSTTTGGGSTGGSGGGGGSGSVGYAITVEDAKNGDISVSTSRASSGTTVTITVDPDTGYVLETLTVLDKNGKEVELTKKGDNKYTFKMPSGKVTVEATFMEDNTMLNYFVDVFASDYYYDAVLWAVENGITNGTSATTFSPSNPCTRAQMATFLWRAAGSPEPLGSTNPFEDVSADAYYAKAVQWAYEQGITGGTSATTFSPDQTCTRGQMATFLWRDAGSSAVNGEGIPFVDVPADAYYAIAVEWAYEEGITGGTSATTFSPNDPCTRGQMVTFLYRYLVD